MREPFRLSRPLILEAIHDEQLTEHGGLTVRGRGGSQGVDAATPYPKLGLSSCNVFGDWALRGSFRGWNGKKAERRRPVSLPTILIFQR